MPFPNPDAFCLSITINPTEKCITYPGGGQLCVSIPDVTPVGGMHIAQVLLDKLNTALAPAQPIFNIIDAVLAVFECIKAISTLNPVKIIECIPGLAQKINALLKLIPQLSLPALIADALDCLAAWLTSLKNNLLRQQEYLDRILAAELAGANTDIELGPIIDCATADLDAILIWNGEQATPINRIIGILNSFLQLLGLPCIPSLSAPSLDAGFLLLLDKLVELLNFIASLINFEIPVPQLEVSAEDC